MDRGIESSGKLMELHVHPGEQLLNERLKKREAAGLIRKLPQQKGLVDFCSNDYLGLSCSKALQQKIFRATLLHTHAPLGATGSRLLSGNTEYAEVLEKEIADFHEVEAALLFNSGYTANLGLFSCLAQKGDTIITDERIHSSVIDGCRIGFGKRLKFKHNDLESLEGKLKIATGICYVAIESIYSMDGDLAPLKEINTCCKKYGALLLVDEAHAFGVFGKGLVNLAGLSREVFATLITFGKALGAHGAAVLGSTLLRNYLLNFARPFIYSTAMPFSQLLHLKTAYQFLQDRQELPIILQRKIDLFHRLLSPAQALKGIRTPIHAVIIPGNVLVGKRSRQLAEMGMAVHPILSPTVPQGSERLRICLHTYNTDAEIKRLCQFLNPQNLRT